MLELMVVIVIIGILASLAYSSLIDMIFTNRAKETAQAMRTFAERALAEAKRQSLVVTLSLDGGNMVAEFKEKEGSDTEKKLTQPLSDGFRWSAAQIDGVTKDFGKDHTTSEQVIGVSGITESGYFAACGGKGYCGAAVKKEGVNSFEAQIKKGSNAQWRAI
jgi:prepilin-type N-terminal cleavage/methylation domain-containing protein